VRILAGVVICLVFVTLGACSNEALVDGSSSTGLDGVSSIPVAVDTQATQGQPGVKAPEPYWEVDSLEAVNLLLDEADGQASYQVFDALPAGLQMRQANLAADMSDYNLLFVGPGNKQIALFVFTAQAQEDWSQFEQMEVDGTTYYYHQRFDAGGDLVTAYFDWRKGANVFHVEPGEAITPEVIRKYSRMKSVGFNTGKKQVGFGTGIPLIADSKKIVSLVSGNSGIRYHTGTVLPGKDNDLLEP
jgi:hypothetical protein